jgi:hypothetical protein
MIRSLSNRESVIILFRFKMEIPRPSAALETGIPEGDATAVTPKIARILNRLLPTAFPTAVSRSPRTQLTTEVANLGSEVPIAATGKPMIDALTSNARVTVTVPTTSQQRPITRSTVPDLTDL